MVLAKLHITVDGGEVKSEGDGHLHFRFDGSGAGSHPFKVTGSGGSYKVEPGTVYSNLYSLGVNPTIFFIPKIGNQDLDHEPPPVITTSSLFNGFIVLTAVFDHETGSAKSYPWKVQARSNLVLTPLIRQVGSIAGQSSEWDFILAEIENGVVKTQGLRTNIFATSSGNSILIGPV